MAELNLIPSSMKSKRNLKSKKLNAFYIVIIMFAILFFGIYFPYLTLQSTQNKEAALKSQVDAQYNVIVERNNMIAHMSKTNELVTKVENLEKNRVLTFKQIVELQKSTPMDVSFVSLSYTSDQIAISGSTKDYNSPAVFAANLQETELYKNARLISVMSNQGNYDFNVSINLK